MGVKDVRDFPTVLLRDFQHPFKVAGRVNDDGFIALVVDDVVQATASRPLQLDNSHHIVGTFGNFVGIVVTAPRNHAALQVDDPITSWAQKFLGNPCRRVAFGANGDDKPILWDLPLHLR